MESILTLCGKLKELLTNKQLAATICIAWALLHITACLPAQFIQLLTYCHEHMHWIDLLGILATARMLAALLSALYRLLKPSGHRAWLRILTKKEIKRILNTPHSEDHKTLTLLYNTPDSPLNPYAPLTKLLRSAAVITPTTIIADANIRTKIYTCPFQLTHYARQYMETYRHRQHTRRSRHIRLLLFLARCLKARRKSGPPSNDHNSTSSK
ncbi:MAG: hypothetical protein IJN29_09315 [Akkermansia sp.]|nr:hypothetical protein [Akkermansia sp.]